MVFAGTVYWAASATATAAVVSAFLADAVGNAAVTVVQVVRLAIKAGIADAVSQPAFIGAHSVAVKDVAGDTTGFTIAAVVAYRILLTDAAVPFAAVTSAGFVGAVGSADNAQIVQAYFALQAVAAASAATIVTTVLALANWSAAISRIPLKFSAGKRRSAGTVAQPGFGAAGPDTVQYEARLASRHTIKVLVAAVVVRAVPAASALATATALLTCTIRLEQQARQMCTSDVYRAASATAPAAVVTAFLTVAVGDAAVAIIPVQLFTFE